LNSVPEFAILVSCVGRKIVLNQLTQDEVEAVTENFDSTVAFSGFYSNGEISKMKFVDSCKLHNQTMTITLFSEKNS
jgi:small ligand-binding sensory domain FIST